MPLLQVCPTLNDRTPDNPWPQREQVPEETFKALPADADVIREATARLRKAPAQAPALVAHTPHAPALVAQTPRVAEAETPMPDPTRLAAIVRAWAEADEAATSVGATPAAPAHTTEGYVAAPAGPPAATKGNAATEGNAAAAATRARAIAATGTCATNATSS